MRFSLAAIIATLFVQQPGEGVSSIREPNLRPSPLMSLDINRGSYRVLKEVNDFEPLNCNAGVVCGTSKEWTPWSEVFGNDAFHKDRVIVPCGSCIEMDFPGPNLTLRNGIDIRGELFFSFPYFKTRDTYLTVNTTLIAVQGKLLVFARKPLDGMPSVRFLMTGEEDQFFVPYDNNAKKCNDQIMCNAGKKAIVVAGGSIRRKTQGERKRTEFLLALMCETHLGSFLHQ